MLNKIWPIFILVSIIFSFVSGKTNEINESIFSSTKTAIDVIVTMTGSIALWSGFMKIANNTRIINILSTVMNPVINMLFPDLKKNSESRKYITMNIIANFLGLGNAATPIGIKAMDILNKENTNSNYISNSMMMFILINTASIQLIPTTVFAIRQSLESSNISQIIIPTWMSTILAATAGIIALKIFIKKGGS